MSNCRTKRSAADLRKLSGPEVVLATRNEGKIAELSELLARRGITPSAVSSFGLDTPAETADTLQGNARLKALCAAAGSGLPALSDDSGLEVDALDGAPGVRTAEWAETGTRRDYRMAMEMLRTRLEASELPEPWSARFRCVVCIAWPDGEAETFSGVVDGMIVWPMRGDKGFGFDPVFVPDGDWRTFAEMTPEEKSRYSHRARAVRRFAAVCLGT